MGGWSATMLPSSREAFYTYEGRGSHTAGLIERGVIIITGRIYRRRVERSPPWTVGPGRHLHRFRRYLPHVPPRPRPDRDPTSRRLDRSAMYAIFSKTATQLRPHSRGLRLFCPTWSCAERPLFTQSPDRTSSLSEKVLTIILTRSENDYISRILAFVMRQLQHSLCLLAPPPHRPAARPARAAP